MTRTLVIAAHMDDEVLGAGGLIRKRICCGDTVFVLTVFGRKYPAEPGGNEYRIARQFDHWKAAKDVLGYQEGLALDMEEGEPAHSGYYKLLVPIEQVLTEFAPTEVVIPAATDLNQDHRFLHDVCGIALRVANRVPDPQQGPIKRCLEMFGHDTLGQPDPNYVVPLTDPMVQTVLKAWSCYEDEQRPFPHVRSVQSICSRYRYWGSQFGFSLAEPYRLVFGVD
jgi:LmbE family N-acetylglucosaminyl deacetylase